MFGSKRGVIAAGAVLAGAALLLAGCSSSGTLSGGSTGSTAKTTVTIGSAAFPENVVLGYVYGQALAANGFNVSAGAEGVGRATTRAVVLGCIGIILADMVFTFLTSR